MRINFSDIQEAFDFVSFGHPLEHAAYLCPETGKIYWYSEYGDNEEPLPEDIDDAQKYIAIPHKNDLDLGKSLVLRFAETHLPDSYGKVMAIFRRPGAYSRFKALLDSRGMLQQWYEYEEAAKEEGLRRWCKDHHIEITG